MSNQFRDEIMTILAAAFGEAAEEMMERSHLLQYLELKTRSANRGSKSRGSFANLYAIYVLTEDYIAYMNTEEGSDYSAYGGAKFSALFARQRELPFGEKLQNHALNHRLNEEYKKYFPADEHVPIIRDPETNRYWINERLLTVRVGKEEVNIAQVVVEIIDSYVARKQDSFKQFISTCEQIQGLSKSKQDEAVSFVVELLQPNVDARIFEIVSYAVLKFFYHDQHVYFGFSPDEIREETLQLFKTGRTNANDGGIDFVMRPLGRFFQVTETTEVNKYLLDIDKLEHYPVTFVVKSDADPDSLHKSIEENATEKYSVKKIVAKYMSAVEEIINLPILIERFETAVNNGYLKPILDEIIIQSRVEFHMTDEEE